MQNNGGSLVAFSMKIWFMKMILTLHFGVVIAQRKELVNEKLCIGALFHEWSIRI